MAIFRPSLAIFLPTTWPPVYLHLIFEISSVTRFFFNFKLDKKSISKQTRFFVEFELDFYCLCSLQKSISKSNWLLSLIFRNWKKIEWHSIFQKSSGDRQGVIFRKLEWVFKNSDQLYLLIEASFLSGKYPSEFRCCLKMKFDWKVIFQKFFWN